MRINNIILIAAGLFSLFSSCLRGQTNDSVVPQPRWQTISAEEARELMEKTDNFILLDVRTVPEFQEIRIEGSILIPNNEIKDRAEAELPDKNVIILVYCRSGRRSASAASDLAKLGYTNVYDIGGISNWPFETVSG